MSKEIRKETGKMIGRIWASCDMDIPTDDLINMSGEEFRNALFQSFQKQFPALTKEIYKAVIVHYNENPSSLTLKDHIGWYFDSLEILADKKEFALRMQGIKDAYKDNPESPCVLMLVNRDLHPMHYFESVP